MTTMVFLGLLLHYMLVNIGTLGMYFQIKLIGYIFLYGILIERDYIPRLFENLKNFKFC